LGGLACKWCGLLSYYFGFFHGGLTDLWISPGFEEKGEKLAEMGGYSQDGGLSQKLQSGIVSSHLLTYFPGWQLARGESGSG
jgi:hypothetical protein